MKESNELLYKCLQTKDDLVGIEFTETVPNVYFPLGYKLPEEGNELEEKKSILDLLRTLSLCKNDQSFEKYDLNEGLNNIIPINSYLWIINDYLKNGLYTVYEKKYVQSQKGKINWKRTLRTKPLFDKDEIIYLNPLTEIKTQNDNIITEIHAICINISIDKIGWLFGKIPKVEKYSRNYDNTVYLDILKSELAKSFNDNKKTLIKHLINVLKEQNENDNLDIVNNLLVKNYSSAWEKMIDNVFGNVNNKKEFFPEIIWNLHKGKNPEPTMRPDTIITDDDNIYIVDAKYYKHGVEENGSLPGAESVDKQLTYGEYNQSKYGKKKVYNAFIIPFDKDANLFKSNKSIISIGTVKSIGRVKGFLYENIVVLLMDTRHLIDLYFGRINIKEAKKEELLLINSIINELK